MLLVSPLEIPSNLHTAYCPLEKKLESVAYPVLIIGNLHVRLTFNLGKTNKIFYYI